MTHAAWKRRSSRGAETPEAKPGVLERHPGAALAVGAGIIYVGLPVLVVILVNIS